MIMHQGQVWARRVEVAARWHARMRGLLGRDGLGDSAAMVILHCNAVHTLGMRFAIDLVFVDKASRVVRVVKNVRPWRFSVWGGWSAAHVIESEAGRLDLGKLSVGDVLELRA
ncbi:MAG: DUF192 domain-containing protein [Kiritimatiellaeota bacterium]|nr:DUF192 domain-containing protein [Kiritimatiellota bacterium]